MVAKTYLEGEQVCQEGEEVSQFCVVYGGNFLAKNNDGSEESYGKGTVFGDSALMFNHGHFSQTVVATTDSEMFTINRNDFSHAVAHEFAEVNSQMNEFAKKVPLLKDLAPQQLAAVLAALTPAYFENGEKIISQGDEGDSLYIIEEGKVVVKYSQSLCISIYFTSFFFV